jgi:hypothetical protein
MDVDHEMMARIICGICGDDTKRSGSPEKRRIAAIAPKTSPTIDGIWSVMVCHPNHRNISCRMTTRRLNVRFVSSRAMPLLVKGAAAGHVGMINSEPLHDPLDELRVTRAHPHHLDYLFGSRMQTISTTGKPSTSNAIGVKSDFDRISCIDLA